MDDEDRELGFASKQACHEGDGVLHRAFSAFLFNDAGELLLQQRSALKPLWPLYWSNESISKVRATCQVLASIAEMTCHCRA